MICKGGGRGTLTDMAYKSCVLDCGGYRSWGKGNQGKTGEGRGGL